MTYRRTVQWILALLFALLPAAGQAALQDWYGVWRYTDTCNQAGCGEFGTCTVTIVPNTATQGTANFVCSGSYGTNTLVYTVTASGMSHTESYTYGSVTYTWTDNEPGTVQGNTASGTWTSTYQDSTGYSSSASGGWMMTRLSAGGPTCTLSANPASIAIGGSSTLTASCSPTATSYNWTGGTCAGVTGPTCVASPTETITYSVTGSNAGGPGNTSRATVTPFSVQATVVGNEVKAVISYNSSDTDKSGSVYTFGYLPANSPLFGNASRSGSSVPKAGTGLVLAVLTASGWQQVLSGSSVSAVYSGTLSSSTNAFALYVAGLFDQSQDAGIMCVAYTTAPVGNAADQGLPVVVGRDPSVTCPSVTLSNTPRAGVWWNPAEGGRGFVIEGQGSNLFMGAFLYDGSGRATWYAAGGGMNGDTFIASLTPYSGGQTLTGAYKPSTAGASPGNVSITFTDASNGTLTWPGGVIPIRRFDVVAGGAAMTPPAGTPETGIWWNPAESGRGFAFEIQGGTMFMGGYMYDAAGNPVWYLSGQAPMADAMTYIGTWSQLGNGQTLTGSYQPPTTVDSNAGSVTIRFSDTQNAILTLPDGRTIPITRFRF